MANRNLFSDAAGSIGGRRKPPDGEFDITPMIDVTFLLLIFFMVSSTMQGEPDIDIPPAQHSLGIDAAGAAVVTILAPANSSESAQIILGDVKGQAGNLNEVKQYIESHVREGRLQVVIKAEGDVPHGLVEDVARQIKSVEGVEIFMGVGDKPVE